MNLDYITYIARVVIVNDYVRKFMGKTLKYPQVFLYFYTYAYEFSLLIQMTCGHPPKRGWI